MMVWEETEGDEFRQEPEPGEVEDACEEPLDQNTIRCGGAMLGRVTPGRERRVFSPGCLRDDLRSDPYYPFTLVQETDVISIWHQCHRIVAARRDSHPDCLQPVNRSYRVRKISPHQRTLPTGFFQVQMDNASHCIDCICGARNCKPFQVTTYVSSPLRLFVTTPPQTLKRRFDPPRDPGPDLARLHRRLPARGVG